MIDVWNRIITNLTAAEAGVCDNVTATVSGAPPQLPVLEVSQLDASDFSVDLEVSDAAVRVHMELTAYSSVSLTEARNVSNIAREAMRQMGFACDYGPRPVPNMNVNIYRVVARYSRTIGDGDDIGRINS